VNEDLRRDRLAKEVSTRGVRHAGVLEAIRRVPRDRFVDEALAATAYADAALPIGEKQSISQPSMVARMTELLEPDGTGKALEIGSGSGYQAAVLSHVFEQVYSVERLATLSRRARQSVRALGIENVHFKIFDGTYGWGEFAPYRAILVTAAAPDVPAPLIAQLADGGRLVIPIAIPSSGPGRSEEQILVRLRKVGDQLERTTHGACRFVPLLGKYGWSDPLA